MAAGKQGNVDNMTAITWPRAAVARIGGTARFVPTAARVIATTLALSALAFTAGLARAADPIMGEFGVALGEPFDKDQVIGRRALTDSSVSAWQFRPEIPLDIFREYYVVVAPDDNVVLGILARSDRYASMAECRAIMDALGLLIARYGQLASAEQPNQEFLYVNQGGRAVFLRCLQKDDYWMDLQFVDRELHERARSDM